ncbi:MAG: aminopeptidase P family protein [Mangrovibacterium sp.]
MNKIITDRLSLLRKEMKKINADAFYFSGTDPHHSEYLADHWKSISYFSGFTGSAATFIVTQKEAALWTDSRYFIQAGEELAGTGIKLQKLGCDGTETHTEWIINRLQEAQIATDLTCLTVDEYQSFDEDFQNDGFHLPYRIIDGKSCLDAAWKNRPAIPANLIFEHNKQFCGQTRSEKIEAIKDYCLYNSSCFGVFLTALDEIAWTFNLRGSDVAYNPVFLSYALINDSETILFIQKDCLSNELKAKLQEENISIGDYNNMEKLFETYSYANSDPSSTPVIFDTDISSKIDFHTNVPFEHVEDIFIDPMFILTYANSPVKALKAIKAESEIKHIQEAMRKDGVAMTKFLYWLNENIGGNKVYNEYHLVEVLNGFRSEQEGFKGNSFYPIMSYKANGAIVHRSVTKESAVDVEGNGLLLFDSGGQYLDGTTDITRTVAIGCPSEEEKRDFTLVLKGMIALSQVKFPEETPGCNLDVLARQALWQHGLNYGHGTGHGIGYFLNVHEGPQSIRQQYNPVALKPGMVLSNEPGLYKEGKYGIRTENAMVCVKDEKTEFGQFLSFQTLTLCPIDKRLIDKSLLNIMETDWLNSYHEKCYEKLSGSLNDHEKEYLRKLTLAI